MKSAYRPFYFYAFVFAFIVCLQWLGTYVYGHVALWSIENKHLGIQPRFAQLIVAITAWAPLGILGGVLVAVFLKGNVYKTSLILLIEICLLLALQTYFTVVWDVVDASVINVLTSLLLLPMLVLGVSLIGTVQLVERIKKIKRLPDN